MSFPGWLSGPLLPHAETLWKETYVSFFLPLPPSEDAPKRENENESVKSMCIDDPAVKAFHMSAVKLIMSLIKDRQCEQEFPAAAMQLHATKTEQFQQV